MVSAVPGPDVRTETAFRDAKVLLNTGLSSLLFMPLINSGKADMESSKKSAESNMCIQKFFFSRFFFSKTHFESSH